MAFAPLARPCFSVATQPASCFSPATAYPYSSVKISSSTGKEQDSSVESINQDADAIFVLIDKNGDGKVTLEELIEHMTKSGYGEDVVKKVFNKFDINSDGGISKEEFRTGLVQYSTLRAAPGLGSYNSEFVTEIHADSAVLFRAVDADGNGTISMDELKELMVRETKFSDVAIRKIFYMLDVDNDGQISEEELREAFVKYSALRQALGQGPNYK